MGDVTIINLLILLSCLGVLGLNIKLYTEILKDARFNARAKRRRPEEAPDGD